ncbi:hypothetical protein Tco_0923464 [Tanacetum coccineum]|uniref:Uncharacterized protein n=1 Tax=Tanacetum coccineum TaxID=301880 RepID=A0ABQ5D122_9ASTR
MRWQEGGKLGAHRVGSGIAITGHIQGQLSPATCRWGKVCHRGTNCLTEKRVGPTSSLGIIAGDCIPDEDSPATIPQRHFDGDRFPQRHVAGESPEMLPGKTRLL